MFSAISWTGLDPKVVANYLFGIVIIVMYAKDKFNTPTYDRESMGPFSQLPPQFLTIDARYRQGMRTYILLLLALYTALCIIGPYTFGQQGIQLGVSLDAGQLWPVASATFLISTGAAKDTSVLGRIEHFIRQYAQRSAYIPSIVSNLAYSIRNVETIPWLKENKDKLKSDDFEDRKAALTALIGRKFVTRLNENPRQQGHLAAWARANIVFYCMQQMFRGVVASEKLSQITDLPENAAIFDKLKKEREELERRFIVADEQREKKSDQQAEVDFDKLLSDVQRFSKEVSLTIVVLLSQSVRTFSDLRERLEQLGFRDIELRDNSDHLVYLVMVNFCILLGAFISYVVVTAVADLATLKAFRSVPYLYDWVQGIGGMVTQSWLANDFSVIDHAGELLLLATGALIYMIAFKVIDYLREGSLDLSEWRESLQGYVMVVVKASVCSAIICILLMVLLLSPLGLLRYMWTDPAGLGQQLVFQFLVAGLAAGFAVSYLRHAVKLRWSNGKQKGLLRVVLEGFFLFRERADFTKLIHGLLAACLVGLLTHVITVHDRNKRIDAAKSSLEIVRASFDQNQGWLSQRAKAAERSGQPAAREASLLPADLIGINCKLRDMYAALHVFDVGEEYFQLDSDFAKAPTEGSANGGTPRSARDPASIARCPALKARDATITTQIDHLKDICSKLNRVGMIKTAQAVPSNAQDGSNPAQGQRIIVPTLFLASEKCELNRFTTDDSNEKDFRGLGNSLSEFFFVLDSLSKISSGAGGRVVVFPMISAFCIAYMFGAGARVWRAWWLNNEAGQQEMRKLKEQIESISGFSIQPEAFETWLSSPLGFLNNVAPKEAVRYEGLKARLYAKIENGQIDFGAIDASSAMSAGAVVGGEPALSHR